MNEGCWLFASARYLSVVLFLSPKFPTHKPTVDEHTTASLIGCYTTQHKTVTSSFRTVSKPSLAHHKNDWIIQPYLAPLFRHKQQQQQISYKPTTWCGGWTVDGLRP